MVGSALEVPAAVRPILSCPVLSPPCCPFCEATMSPHRGDPAWLPSLAHPCCSYSDCSHRHIFLALCEVAEQLGKQEWWPGPWNQLLTASILLGMVISELAEPVLGQLCSAQGLALPKGVCKQGSAF